MPNRQGGEVAALAQENFQATFSMDVHTNRSRWTFSVRVVTLANACTTRGASTVAHGKTSVVGECSILHSFRFADERLPVPVLRSVTDLWLLICFVGKRATGEHHLSHCRNNRIERNTESRWE